MNRFLLFIVGICFAFLALGQEMVQYEPGTLIFKVKEVHRQKCAQKSIAIPQLNQIIADNQGQPSKIFPNHLPPKVQKNAFGQALVDLSLIYRLDYSEQTDPRKLARQLMNTGLFEYVTPRPIDRAVFTPSDTLITQQYWLNNIRAYEAWDATQGDTSTVIAIVDTGMDMDHPDLQSEIAYNWDDPVNGVDDDNDGYVDNYVGWDVAMNDNDPGFALSGHGTNVAALAGAATNNVTGIAGAAFKGRLMTVKIDNDNSGRLTASYEGIVYAADAGADIINNSWGSFSGNAFGQDIVNYAAINKNALVIAAVGNNNLDRRFYPAAYENVLSVGASEINDFKKDNSNYGHWVDIFAPGDNMLTANVIGGYGTNGGTSMAAPVVSGVAALVKAQFPQYNGQQLAHQLMNTADNIDAINDAIYANKLGNGRVNAHRAVTESSLPGIAMTSYTIQDGNDQLLRPGETFMLDMEFFNYLADATNVNITLNASSNHLELLQSNTTFGQFLGNTSKNANNSFQLKVKENVPFNTEAEIHLSIQADGNYQQNQYFVLQLNNDFISIEENQIFTTLTSTGRLGYNDTQLQEGIGWRYKGGNSLLFEGSFAMGDSPNRVADAFRASQGNNNMDFERLNTIAFDQSTKADVELSTTFNGSAHPSTPMDIDVFQKHYIYRNAPDDNYVIYVYGLKNTSASTINQLYAGLMLDWDIANFAKNKIYTDQSRKLSITHATDSGLYCGIKLLSPTPAVYYAIDNDNNGNGGVDPFGDFTEAEKYSVLSSNRFTAGEVNQEGNDVIAVLSSGPFDLASDSMQVIAFALLTDSSEAALQQAADNAQQKYDDLALGIIDLPQNNINTQIKLFPSPAQEELQVSFGLNDNEMVELAIWNARGSKVLENDMGIMSKGNHQIALDLRSLKSAVYFLEISLGSTTIRNKFVIAK